METTIDPMSDERIIEALKELKKMWFGKSPAKYQFALGYAIRKFEEPLNNTVEDRQANYCTCKVGTNFPCKFCIDKSHGL